jgi:hypothetical protein
MFSGPIYYVASSRGFGLRNCDQHLDSNESGY